VRGPYCWRAYAEVRSAMWGNCEHGARGVRRRRWGPPEGTGRQGRALTRSTEGTLTTTAPWLGQASNIGGSGGGGVAIVVVLIVLVGMAVSGGVGVLIGRGKGRARAGFYLGAFLGWVGWIVVALLRPTAVNEARRQLQIDDVKRSMQGDTQHRGQRGDSSQGWFSDPFGRHDYRYFDGSAWSPQVADDGAPGHDPIRPATDRSVSRPEWFPDPFERYDYRLWDGAGWTAQVASEGKAADDPDGLVPPAVRVLASLGVAGGSLVASVLADGVSDDGIEEIRPALESADDWPERIAWCTAASLGGVRGLLTTAGSEVVFFRSDRGGLTRWRVDRLESVVAGANEESLILVGRQPDPVRVLIDGLSGTAWRDESVAVLNGFIGNDENRATTS
jgi:hypothetical protein